MNGSYKACSNIEATVENLTIRIHAVYNNNERLIEFSMECCSLNVWHSTSVLDQGTYSIKRNTVVRSQLASCYNWSVAEFGKSIASKDVPVSVAVWCASALIGLDLTAHLILPDCTVHSTHIAQIPMQVLPCSMVIGAFIGIGSAAFLQYTFIGTLLHFLSLKSSDVIYSP